MNAKETIVQSLQNSGYDTITACEIADKVLEDTKKELANKPVGSSIRTTAPNGDVCRISVKS